MTAAISRAASTATTTPAMIRPRYVTIIRALLRHALARKAPSLPNPSLGIRGRSSNGEMPTFALGASVRAAADGHADHGRGRGHCDNRPGRDHDGTLPSTTARVAALNRI